jgi:MFS family permease
MSRADGRPSAGTLRRGLAGARRASAAFPRQFWFLTAGILVYVVAVDLCFPFETFYLSNGLHISMTAVGVVLGVAGLAGLPVQLVGGALADRFGRRAVLVTSVCGSAVLYLGLALSHTLLQVVVVVVFEACFGWAMFLTGSNAMIADLVREPRRAEAFSIVRTAINASMVIGPAIAFVFLGRRPDYRLLFAVGGSVCLVFLAVVAVLRETKPPAAAHSAAAGGDARVLRDGRFLAFCAVSLLPLYGFGQIMSIFPVALQRAHGISAGQWDRLLIVYALGLSLLQFPVVRLTRRWDPFALLAGASALMGLGLGLAPLLPWGWESVLLVLLVSLGVVILVPVWSTVVAAFAPVELRGRYMGVWTIAYLGGYALGPLCGGHAVDALGAVRAFLVTGGAGLAGAACFALLATRPSYRDLHGGPDPASVRAPMHDSP